MMDLVEHLRREASKQDMLACEDMLQAADEIAKLRAEVEGLQADVKRLRAALMACVLGSRDWMEKGKAALADQGKG